MHTRIMTILLLAVGLVSFATVWSTATFAEETPATAPANTITWIENFEEAKALAKKEGKDLFVDFTGSDWCGWCWKLRDEVLVKEEFIKGANKRFVFVELDFPKKKQLAADLKKQNDDLMKQYGVQGFPTILIMDYEGTVIGRTGYKAGGPAAYLKMISDWQDGNREAVKLIEKADEVKGLDRAKLLDQALDKYDAIGIESPKAAGWIKEILEADADGKAGLKLKTEMRESLNSIVKLAADVEAKGASAKDKEADTLIANADAFVTKYNPTGQILQKALWAKSSAYFVKKDWLATLETAQKAMDADPESPLAQQISKGIAWLKKKIQK